MSYSAYIEMAARTVIINFHCVIITWEEIMNKTKGIVSAKRDLTLVFSRFQLFFLYSLKCPLHIASTH